MKLWIRSQDRKQMAEVSSIQIIKLNDSSEYAIISYNDVIGDFNLGFYKTEKRALEVLDEIQKLMSFNETAKGSYEEMDLKIKILMLIHLIQVYEMPKE